MNQIPIYKNEYHELLGKIYAQCQRDPAFKERFLKDPKAVIEAEGLSVPPSVTIKAVEETEPNILTLHLPPKPAEELSDEDLEMVSGGKSGEENKKENNRAEEYQGYPEGRPPTARPPGPSPLPFNP